MKTIFRGRHVNERPNFICLQTFPPASCCITPRLPPSIKGCIREREREISIIYSMGISLGTSANLYLPIHLRKCILPQACTIYDSWHKPQCSVFN